MDQPQTTNSKKVIAVVVVIALIGIIAAITVNSQQSEDTTADSSATTSVSSDEAETSEEDTTAVATSDSNYADGTYETTQRYATPGGSESIEVSLTISDGVITSVNTTASEGDRDAAEYQGDFLAAYEDSVVGKVIDGLSLSRVAGASLTTRAFNNALETIRDDAAAT